MSDSAAPSGESFCTFCVDDCLYGIEVQRVQEVIRADATTRVPLAPKIVRGLMNLRGQIVTALNLREALGISSRSTDSRQMNVVIRSAAGPISLLVDEIGDVVRVEQDRFEPIPGSSRINRRDLLRGAYKLDDQLLLVLDVQRVTDVAA